MKGYDVESIFRKLGIDGDIDPLESNEDFWERKLIEVYEKMSVLLIDVGGSNGEK